MDNLTHTLIGLMLSRAGLNRLCPRATPLLMLAANVPDLDVVTALGGTLTYLDHHRGITHALIAAPAMALLAALIVRAFGPLPLGRATALALVGVISHLLLDWTNNYGIRLLLPFSSEWLRLDITNVVDAFIWAVLLLAVAGPLLSKLVSSEMGAKPSSGQGGAIFALLLILAYEGARWVLHERATAVLESHSYEGAPARRAAAFPNFANPFVWNTLIEGRGFVSTQSVNLLGPYDPTAGRKAYTAEPGPALEAARATDTFHRYLNFSQFPFWRVTPLDVPEGGMMVEAMDLRFGEPDTPRFVAGALIDRAGKVVEQSFSFGPFRLR